MMKKMIVNQVALTVALTLTAQGAWADSNGAVKPPEVVRLNPASLREQVMTSNLSLVQAMNSVRDAKDRVNVARGNLLPSINLGGALAMSSGATFLVASASFLLPFLMPSRWFDQAQSKDLFESEKLSFQLAELNTYSSALTLYQTILSDQQTQIIYDRQAQDLRQIAQLLERSRDVLGNVTDEEVDQAKAQADMAEVRSSKLAELGIQEIAAMRMALGLPVTTRIELEEGVIPGSEWEGRSLIEAIEAAKKTSLERKQVDYLVSAAKSGRWSKAFSFLTGFSLAASSQIPGESVSFGNSSVTGTVNFGFAYFPTLSLSQRSIEEMKMRGEQIEQETSRLIEATSLSLNEAARQYQLSSGAEDAMNRVYRSVLRKYEMGSATLLEVLSARTQLADASVSRVKSQLDLNSLRITLHRAFITDQFKEIPQCKLNAPVNSGGSGGFWGWLRGSSGGGVAMSPEKACR